MDSFVKYYNEMVGADYFNISDFIDKSIKKYKPGSELVCDLGCGTGEITCDLSKRGYDMIGIDINEDMLVKAGEKAKALSIDNLLLLCQDITNFELYK